MGYRKLMIKQLISICILTKVLTFPCFLAYAGDGEMIEIKKLSVKIQFPSGYPPAEFKDKGRLREEELMEVGLYKTSNIVNGNVNIDGPRIKQFFFLYSRCPQELGCSLEEEVNDFVAIQENNGAKVLKRRNRKIEDKNAVEMILTRNVNNATIFYKTVFIFHKGYVLNQYVLVQSVNDLGSSSVESFFNSLQFEERRYRMTLFGAIFKAVISGALLYILIHFVIYLFKRAKRRIRRMSHKETQ